MYQSEFVKKLTFLTKLLAPQKKSAVLIFFLIIVGAITESFGISMIFPILQIIVKGELQGWLAQVFGPALPLIPQNALLPVLCLFYLAIIILNVSISIAKLFFSRRLIWQLKMNWIMRIFTKYNEAKYSFILNHKQGELVNNVIFETENAAQCLIKIVDYVSKIVILTAMFITLCFINWRATLVLSLFLCIFWLLTNKALKSYVRKKGADILRLRQQILAETAESIGTLHLIKILGISSFFIKKIKQMATDHYRLLIRVSILKSLLENMGQLVMAFAVVGSILFINYFSDIVIIDLVPTLGVMVLLAQKMVGSVSGLASTRVTILSQMPSVALSHKLSEHHIPQENIAGGDEFKGLQDDIVFQNVTFSYEAGKTVLSEWNMVIPLGKITAIVGPSGIGKSTIVNLLAGLYEPNDGCILCNGRNLSEWKLQSWRRKIGYVSQDTQLFNMSIRENILLGDPYATENDIINAAKLANAHDFIDYLPNGYDTVIGERGLKLSGGQRQRIAIAIALIRNPDLFIFDEATSALDKTSEELIQKSIEEIRKEKTIIIIAHRPSTIETADVIYDLGKTEIAETSDAPAQNIQKDEIVNTHKEVHANIAEEVHANIPKKRMRGILYIATGERYVVSCINSAKSALHHCKGRVGVSICCDKEHEKLAKESELFDHVIIIKNPHRRSKVDYIRHTPYTRTLYLDADSFVVADITEMFTLLDRFDIAMTHAHMRNHKLATEPWREALPSAFPQFNGGVLLYRWNDKVEQFCKDWSKYYVEAGFSKDQVTLRELLWKSDLHLYALPPEYNFRYFYKLPFLPTKELEPKILHYRYAFMYDTLPLYFWKVKWRAFTTILSQMFKVFKQRISVRELEKNDWKSNGQS